MKRLSKTLAFLLVLALCIGMLPSIAFSSNIITSGSCGSDLKWSYDADGVLRFTGSGAMKDYDWSSLPPWSRYTISDLILPEGLTAIGDLCFSGCRFLNVELKLPSTLVFIGNDAFSEASGFVGDLVIPDSVTGIASMAFLAADFNGELKLSGSVREIGPNAFAYCKGLHGKLVISESVEAIDVAAFKECTGFDELVLGKNLRVIEYYAFENCSGLSSLSLPESLEEVGEGAFVGCSGISSVHVPAGVSGLEHGAFSGMDGLLELTSESADYRTIDGALYTADGTALVCWPGGKSGELVLPQSVTRISDWACLRYHSSTGQLVIPDGVAEVGDYAFFNATGCGELILPESLRSIGDYAFDFSFDEVPPKYVVIPASVRTIGSCAFDAWPEDLILFFEGDAPMIDRIISSGYTRLFYREAANGWTDSPCYQSAGGLWNGMPLAAYFACGSMHFIDVDLESYYIAPMTWAVEQGITNGTTELTFAPEDTCTRSQMVTFLWRAAGCPEPETEVCPFDDVDQDAYYTKAVLWASENGITNGVGDGKFAPNRSVTRGQMATILYRYMGENIFGNNPFTDVGPGNYYFEAVRWAYRSGITKGLTATSFGPDDPCTRSQIVTFLYRAFAE